MSTTRWEVQRAIADRIKAVWDAHRDGRPWAEVYAEAHAKVLATMERDLEMARAMDWSEFKRLQGWPPHHEAAEAAGGR